MQMKPLPQIVSESILFNGLPEPHLTAILNVAVEKQAQKGEMIFSEGDPGDGFYIISDGMIKIYKMSMDGKEQILHMFGPGEVFGEVPVFSGQAFPANAEAAKNSRLLFFPRNAIMNLMATDPTLALNMLAVMARRLRFFTVQIENLSLKEVPARLAGYLLLLAEEQRNKKSVQLNISKGQLASFLGTIPETLSRILKRMSEQALITVEGRTIRLVNFEGIQSLSESGKMNDDNLM